MAAVVCGFVQIKNAGQNAEGGYNLGKRRRGTAPSGYCYYGEKLVGRCTPADSDAYTLLMEECGNDPELVLKNFIVSTDLRAILEKVSKIQKRGKTCRNK